MAINYPEMVLQPLHYVGMFLQASKTFCAGWGQRQIQLFVLNQSLYYQIKMIFEFIKYHSHL